MPGRHCTTCGKRHPINGRRCKGCGAIFRVTEVWEAAIGHPPSLEQVVAMNEHPKFEELCRFDIRRLIASAPAARAGDELDVDAWVAAAIHQALSGPAREPVGPEQMATRHPEAPSPPRPLPVGTRATAPPDRRVALALGLAVIVVFATIVWITNDSGGGSSPPSNGRTAVVERDGDGRTDEELISQVRHDYCDEGYAKFELTIRRSQPAGVSTFVQNC